MNLQEMKSYKQKLIAEGHEVYPIIAKIVDTLGERKTLMGRNYTVIEFDGVNLMHLRNISKAKIGSNQSFQGWLYRDSIW